MEVSYQLPNIPGLQLSMEVRSDLSLAAQVPHSHILLTTRVPGAGAVRAACTGGEHAALHILHFPRDEYLRTGAARVLPHGPAELRCASRRFPPSLSPPFMPSSASSPTLQGWSGTDIINNNSNPGYGGKFSVCVCVSIPHLYTEEAQAM